MVSPDGDDRLNKSKPIWRRLDSSYTPSARGYPEPVLRVRLTRLRSADFWLLGRRTSGLRHIIHDPESVLSGCFSPNLWTLAQRYCVAELDKIDVSFARILADFEFHS